MRPTAVARRKTLVLVRSPKLGNIGLGPFTLKHINAITTIFFIRQHKIYFLLNAIGKSIEIKGSDEVVYQELLVIGRIEVWTPIMVSPVWEFLRFPKWFGLGELVVKVEDRFPPSLYAK